MTRVLLMVILIAAPLASEAQPTGTVPRIGMLCATFCASSTFLLLEQGVFLEALRGLGWVDGQTVLVDDRAAGVGFARLGEAATELVRLKAAVILATDGAAAQAARHVTGSIPIVMVGVPYAVGSGLVATLARPGGNVTGVTVPMVELVGKQLGLPRDMIPSLSRVALLSNPDNLDHPPIVRSAQTAAKQARVQLTVLQARSPHDFDGVFSLVSRAGAHA